MRSVVSLQRGLTKWQQVFVFLLISSLEKVECRWLNGKLHQRRLQTMPGDFWECSRVGCGDQGRRPLRLSHWQSRRTGGSGVSARCRRTPCYHLITGGKQVRSQRVCDTIAHLHLPLWYNKKDCFEDISKRCLLSHILMLRFLTMTVVYAGHKQDKSQSIQMERVCTPADTNILYWQWKETRVMLPCPGGVIVMVCAVNSSSKYRVSVSEVTWGLNGGTSCWSRAHMETYQYCPTVVLLMTICKVSWKASYTGRHPAWAPGWRNIWAGVTAA